MDLRERLRQALASRYVLERELGHGGMATVFLAHDLRHDRSVALKVLHPDLARCLGAERFLREIRTAARPRPRIELYDLAADPWELHNIAGDPAYAKEVRELAGVLQEWIEHSGDFPAAYRVRDDNPADAQPGRAASR